jgi:hypothetical protein
MNCHTDDRLRPIPVPPPSSFKRETIIERLRHHPVVVGTLCGAAATVAVLVICAMVYGG